MSKTILITGIAGHLGHCLVAELFGKGYSVRGLLFKGEKPEKEWLEPEAGITFFTGDVSDKESLKSFFSGLEGEEAYLIHCASYIDIQHKKITERLLKINVEGVKNILSLAKESNIKRTIFISSVDSFKAESILANEDSPFADDPNCGGYAISKSMANEVCLKAKEEGQDVVIVFPSAFIGPYDKGHNHIVQLLIDYLNGGIPGVIKGGYDIADGRDIAFGIVKALFKENASPSYILSGHEISLKGLLEKTALCVGKKKHVLLFPTFLAYIGLPFVKLYCKMAKKRPLYTSFALSVVKHANSFTYERAKNELGYNPRPLDETVFDTVDYAAKTGLLKKN